MTPPPTKENVLDLEVRRKIVQILQDNPGLHLRELARRLDLAVSTAEYHLYHLTKHGVLATREEAGQKCFFPAKGLDYRDTKILSYLRHEAPRRILAELLLEPGLTPGQLREILSMPAPTLSFHLKRLRDADLTVEEADGRTKHVFAQEPERIASLLVGYRESFVDQAIDRFADAWLAMR